MALIEFFLGFFLLCLFTSLCICGFFGATRFTEWTDAETGEKTAKGKILYPYHKFWFHQRKDGSYRFPEKLRDVMIGCITCMPTVYGNLIYILAMFTVRADFMIAGLYAPFNSLFAGMALVGVAHWLTCSFLCTFIWQFSRKFN